MPAPSPVALDALLGRLAAGDRAAFDPLFRAVWPLVLRLCQRLVGDDADDVAQTALLKVFERVQEWDPARPAAPWVLGVAAWECRTYRARTRRRREVSGPLPEAPTAAPDPEHATIARTTLEAVQSVLGALSELDRQTLLATLGDDPTAGGATFRKRRQRALFRFFQHWNRDHDDA